MKKTLIALAAVAAAGSVFAQSTVTISGGVSMGMLKSGASKAAQTTTVGGVDAVNSNSFIFTASEDLGGGLRATAVIQQRLGATNQDSGSGDLFVNLAGPFGQIRAGKFTFNSNAGFNAFASRTVTNVGTTAQQFAGNEQTAAGGTSTAPTLLALPNNNVVQYTTPSFSGLTVTVGKVFDGSANGIGNDATGLKANYAKGPLAVQVARTDAVRVTAGAAKVTTTALSASYDFGVARVFANQFNTKTAGSATKVSGTSLSVAAPMGKATLRAGVRNDKNAAATAFDRTSFGVDYALSKRTTLIAEMAKDKQANTGANKRTNSFIGVAHTF